MTIKVGDTIPDGSFNIVDFDPSNPDVCGVPAAHTTDSLFKDKKVVLIAVPGAYTPTCSEKHFPGFVEQYDKIIGKGIQAVYCLSVNDCFVLYHWGKDQGSHSKIKLLADGSGDYTKKLGLELDLRLKGLGIRSKRYAMIIENKVVKYIGIDEGALQNSTAEAILAKI